MELLPLLCLCLLTRSGVTSADENGPALTVVEGSDVVLPCSLSTKENIEFKLFVWRKVAQKDDGLKEVFLYDSGIHYNNGRDGQSEEFKGRVSHFQDELKHGNASIIIRNTKISDSGNYTCHFPSLQPSQIFYIELVVEQNVITVKEDHDVVLPCSLSTKKSIESELFDWKTVPQKKNESRKEVFMYVNGTHYNKNHPGQSEEFKGRVSHFQDELKHGNASITITNTKISDSGEYICEFPNLQTSQIFHIKLVVVGPLKDRSGENGAAPQPVVTTHQAEDGVLLQCDVNGSPTLKVEWLDSAGKILSAKESPVSEKGGRSYITLNATVTSADDYRCVATQETIRHQISTRNYVKAGSQTHPSDQNLMKVMMGVAVGVLAEFLFS